MGFDKKCCFVVLKVSRLFGIGDVVEKCSKKSLFRGEDLYLGEHRFRKCHQLDTYIRSHNLK